MSLARPAAAVRVLCFPTDGSWVHYAVARKAAVEQPATLPSQLRDRATAWALRQWRDVQTAESGTKYYVRRITTRLLEFVSAEESFLRGIPADSDSIVVLHPRVGHRHPRARDLDSAAVLSHLAVLAQERGALHKKWYIGSVLGLGITVPLMIIPLVPALPAYWNTFRVWSNRRAWLGATRLEQLLQTAAVPEVSSLPPCTRLNACEPGECCRVGPVWEEVPADAKALLMPCELLSPLLSSADDADDTRCTQAAADVERTLDAPDLAEHIVERLRAARTLREQHKQV